MSKSISKSQICCLLDTSAISCLISDAKNMPEHEIIRKDGLCILREEVKDFVISSIVIHELALHINININDKEAVKTIINHIGGYFNILISPLDIHSANNYRYLYENNKLLSKERSKHKIDALIVSHADSFAEINGNRYSEYILVTEDVDMRKYKANTIKILTLSEALQKFGRLNLN